jgi:hypothetical protein
MAFKVIVRESTLALGVDPSAVTTNNSPGCFSSLESTGLPEISDVYEEKGLQFFIKDGRLHVDKGEQAISIYQEWCRVVPVKKIVDETNNAG